MAKTHVTFPNWWTDDSIEIAHIPLEDSSTGWPYHVICLADTPYWLFFPIHINLPWPSDDWINYPLPTDAQLKMALDLIANPQLICDICPDCNPYRNVPHAIRWDLERGQQYTYNTPACPWDGSAWPFPWTPDAWPPARLFGGG